ncbi:MAG: DUF2807 domain-containing protein [Clostridium sp.]|uniref:GIN domain-containing protein n=1 Tax=Clostridium sp. TaxID=1506 RepID=UPI0039EAA7E7
MKKICENDEVAIFSDKEFIKNNGRYIEFSDGSTVDLFDYIITNFGVGEIEIVYLPQKPEQDNLITQRKSIGLVDSISLTGGITNVNIIKSENNENYVNIIGTEEFFKSLYINETRGQLEVQGHVEKNSIVIGEVWINGKRQKPEPDPLYGEITIVISKLNNLKFISNNKSNVYCELPINNLYSDIKGSATINLNEVGKANVNISGSSEVKINSLLENSSFSISGSGDVCINKGIIDEVDLNVSGSGSINAMISVKKAILNLSGSGNIVVENVKEVSKEKKSGSGYIKVLRRG